MKDVVDLILGARRSAFTLIEVLLSTAVLAVLVVLFASMVGQTSALWKRTTGKVEQFRQARNGFERMTSQLAQATLNTYWDYDNPTTPTKYERRSELRFISGAGATVLGNARYPTHCVFFQAPLGLTDAAQPTHVGFENLLCACGFYLEFGSDNNLRPSFISPAIAPLRYRSRLMAFTPAAESNNIYQFTSGPGMASGYTGKNWFQTAVTGNSNSTTITTSHVLAENIIALIITPRLTPEDERAGSGTATSEKSLLAPNYNYDSATRGAAASAAAADRSRLNSLAQLPPILQVTMVAVDEGSAARFTPSTTDPLAAVLAGKFSDTGNYSADLLVSDPKTGVENKNSLEWALINNPKLLRPNYRIFTTNVAIRGAKWSREQK